MSSIERATAADGEAILELLASLELPSAGVDEVEGSFLVARSGATIVGCIGLEIYGDIGLLRSLAVRPSEQGTGTGRRLVEELLAVAPSRGVGDVYLLTTTAERYFPRFGFELIERSNADVRLRDSEELKGACPDTAVCMVRRGEVSSL